MGRHVPFSPVYNSEVLVKLNSAHRKAKKNLAAGVQRFKNFCPGGFLHRILIFCKDANNLNN